MAQDEWCAKQGDLHSEVDGYGLKNKKMNYESPSIYDVRESS